MKEKTIRLLFGLLPAILCLCVAPARGQGPDAIRFQPGAASAPAVPAMNPAEQIAQDVDTLYSPQTGDTVTVKPLIGSAPDTAAGQLLEEKPLNASSADSLNEGVPAAAARPTTGIPPVLLVGAVLIAILVILWIRTRLKARAELIAFLAESGIAPQKKEPPASDAD